jgi:ATP-dependent Clp protease ATP-binding subunit ClpX
VLFIVGGAFAGLDRIVESRTGKKGLGFGAALHTPKDQDSMLAEATPEDLLKFGLIPEFIGRLPVFTALEGLDEETMVRILTEPKNALVRQYAKLFDLDGVDLEFDEEALIAIAAKANERGTGARGLRAIMEEVLMPVMFDVPSEEDITRVVVNKDVVLSNVLPTIVRRQDEETVKRSKRSA